MVIHDDNRDFFPQPVESFEELFYDCWRKAGAELESLENLGGGRHLFHGDLVINRSGSFGYTVRVFPKHSALASKAELGLIANA